MGCALSSFSVCETLPKSNGNAFAYELPGGSICHPHFLPFDMKKNGFISKLEKTAFFIFLYKTIQILRNREELFHNLEAELMSSGHNDIWGRPSAAPCLMWDSGSCLWLLMLRHLWLQSKPSLISNSKNPSVFHLSVYGKFFPPIDLLKWDGFFSNMSYLCISRSTDSSWRWEFGIYPHYLWWADPELVGSRGEQPQYKASVP